MTETKTVGKYFQGVGRRKTSVAQVRIYPKGNGEVTINGKKLAEFIPEPDRQAIILAPITTSSLALDVTIKVAGGGKTGQVEAIRHGISRAIVLMDEAMKPALKAKGFLKRDPREKERKKPGLKKARRATQWRKR